MVLKGVKLRIYPNRKQILQLQQMCGNSRFLWNTLLDMLNNRYELHKNEAKENRKHVMLNTYQMNYLLPQLKQEYIFLKESDSSALQVVTADLYKAFKSFFKNPEHFGKPRFKKRSYTNYAYMGKSKVNITGQRYLQLPKLGFVKSSKTKFLSDCQIKRYTVYHDTCNRWYISFQVETEMKPFEKTGQQIGLDLGLIDMITSSNGFQSGRFLETALENRIKQAQRRYSRRRHQAKVAMATDWNRNILNPRVLNDFKNVERTRVTKTKLQERLANKRKEFLHTLSTSIVKNYDVIVIEDLRSKNMMKNYKLAKSIANASWYDFRRMLEYKCEWYGKTLIVVPPQYTSQDCSHCHYCSGKKPLDIREWTCEKCGMKHHRDVNAARNILERGLTVLETI